MILKVLLLIFAVTVSGARLRFGNAQMHPAAVVGLGNATTMQRETIVVGSYEDAMPLSAYLELPYGLFATNTALALYLYDAWIAELPMRHGEPLHVTLDQPEQSYTVVGIHSSADTVYTPVSRVLFVVEERPRTALSAGHALLKLVNAVAASLNGSIAIEVYSDNSTRAVVVPFASSSDFIEFNDAQVVYLRVHFPTSTMDFTVSLQLDATTVFYLRGDYGPTAGYHGSASVVSYVPALPATCDQGYVESTGVCNCYSGYYTQDSAQLQCSVAAPRYCPWYAHNATLDSAPLPVLSQVRVTAGRLAFTLTSALVHGQRTLLDLAEPRCSYIHAPSYYAKSVQGCADVIEARIPFAHCGFTKSSSATEDVYRGTVVVQQITRVTLDEDSVERVVETPFTFLVRVPTNIAVQSTVEVIAPPPFVVPLSAVLVGQRIDALARSAVLQYATSLPAPLSVQRAVLYAVPHDLDATLQLADVNCTGLHSCVQLLQVDLRNISTCDISGTYAMLLTVACTSALNCPAQLLGTAANVTLQSHIVAQNLCSDASVDIGLYGTLRAYTDSTLTAQALSFEHGSTAYFAIQTSSSQATIAQVTVVAVYYSGPNVPAHYLLSNGTASALAEANNFQTGARSSSQAWFSLEVRVSNLANNTLFKLNDGQRGVYRFVAFVDVEWQFPDATTNKKRVVLQSSVAQNTPYSAEIEITPQDEAPNADATSRATSMCAVSLLVQVLFVLVLLV